MAVAGAAGTFGGGALIYGQSSRSVDNGAVLNGGLPEPHPFWPAPALTLITDHTKHRSRGSGLVILKDKWLFFWREGNIHNAIDPGSVVKMAESRTAGQTLENIRTLYKEPNGITGTDIRARLMGNGRVGVFGSRRDANAGGRVLKPFFAYSDDGGETWSSQILDHFSRAMSPGFTFNRFPSSVGGHDTDAYVLYCHGGSDMHAAYTLDNGRTWRDRVVFNRRFEGEAVGEVSVVRLGQSNRWIMTCRSRGQNPLYKSTDLVNWSGPYGTGKQIGSNPSGIVHNDGHITWVAASRPYHYRNHDREAIPVDGGIFNGLVSVTADAEAIWNDPSAWPDWSPLMYLPVHYDGTFVQHQGHWYLLFGAIEGPMRPGRKYYSQLGLMSSVNAPLRPFDRVLPGWMVEPENPPDGPRGAIEYQEMVSK